MPDSFEKRKRERKKQQKRKEKRERRAQRKAVQRMSPMFHTMLRGSEQQRVETDLWLSVLDLVAVSGWTPPHSEPPAEPSPAAYARPHGLEINEEDAKGLARAIEAVLPAISDEELAPTNGSFGEDHTESLLARRTEGERLALEDASSAQEFLSGPAKQEVERLASFLKAGPVSIEAN